MRGLYLELDLSSREEKALESLENRTKHIELLSVKPGEGEGVRATVFVPESSADFFLKRVRDYALKDTDKGRPLNEGLVARLESARVGSVESLFTDSANLFPVSGVAVWWEVWLRTGSRERFIASANALQIRTKPHFVHFPEREVLLALCEVSELERLLRDGGEIAELRLARDTPAFYLELQARDQRDWAAALVERLRLGMSSDVSVCLLDSGLTRAHPLLEQLVGASDMHCVDPAWGTAENPDSRGHGTGMAGLCLFGDLSELLPGSADVRVFHRLESVKILPPNGANAPDMYGAITLEAIARAEVQAPSRRRAVCLAITSPNSRADSGRPSSWSAAIDQGAFGDGETQRLVVISAGNIRDAIDPDQYLTRNDLEPIESPAQAWNALSVGAFTDKVNIIAPDFRGWAAIAPAGNLSPRSRTSVLWERQWPLKPELVMEGGNLASQGSAEGEDIDDLQLLTTHHQPLVAHFRSFGDTSAAAALVSRMAAQILVEQPRLWPETVRALLVQSAEWTPAMVAQLGASPSALERRAMLRRYGYGVPSLERAIASAKNDLTLVVEDELTPFKKDGSIKTKELNIHRFPWPSAQLHEIGEADVELRVTLSYFVEPNPGERGWTKRHRYASHGLRFELKGAFEEDGQFRSRINRAVELDEENLVGPGLTPDDGWVLGPTLRNVGSIHSDVWRGSAADLAQRNAIGIYPVGGWWREKPALVRWDRMARYSLIVSVRAPSVELDIYTPVATAIQQRIDIGV